MNENLGTLSFEFRAQKAKFLADLDEMDRAVAAKRQKWQVPAGVGVGGGSGGGFATAGVSSGVNVVGTSNGDVTWKLQNAMATHQAGQDSAMSVARRMMGGGGSGGGYSGRRAMFDAMGMDYDDMREQKRESDRKMRENRQRHSALQSSLNKELESADKGDLRSIINPETGGFVRDAGQAREKWYNKSITLRGMLRYSMAAIVVDTLAGELSNQENFHKATRLAGLDQGAQSEALLSRVSSGLGAVPFIGGILSSAASPLITPIQTENALTSQRLSYQDRLSEIGMGTYATRNQAQQSLSYGYTRARLGIDAQREQARARTAGALEDLRSKAGFESGPADDPSYFGALFGGSLMPGATASRLKKYHEERIDAGNFEARNTERRRLIGAAGDKMNAADDSLSDAQRQELKYQGQYDVSMADIGVQRTHEENMGMPATAAANAAVRAAAAAVKMRSRPGISDEDRDLLTAGIRQQREDLGAMQFKIGENYRWGNGQQYDPYVQSTAGMTDRSQESQADAWESVKKSIDSLNDTLKNLAGKP